MKKVVEIALLLAFTLPYFTIVFEDDRSERIASQCYLGEPSSENENPTKILPISYKTIVLTATILRRTPPVRIKSLRLYAVRPSIHAVALHRSALRSSDIPTFRI